VINQSTLQIGTPAEIINTDGCKVKVTITGIKWDEVVWNPVTQSDGAWMYEVSLPDGNRIWGHRHNLITAMDN
jgi:hypothetical protein